MKIENKATIDVQEWDKIVQETYGRVYSLQQQDGCQERGLVGITVPNGEKDPYENDIVPEVVNDKEMGVSFKAWLERPPHQVIPNQKYPWELELWWQRNFYPEVGQVANDLHKRGLIPAGEYFIDIDW